MGDTYRIKGSTLGEDELWIDATVVEVTIDEEVTLEEDVSSNPRTWTTTTDEFRDWQDRTLLEKRANLEDKDHPIWSCLKDAHRGRKDPPHNEAAESIDADLSSAWKTVLAAQHS